MVQYLRAIYGRLLNAISHEKYARWIGVSIGKNCVIANVHWPSEPYLIKIGNNVALTHGVQIHTHGGGRVARIHIPEFDVFGKVTICDNAYIGAGSQIMPGVTVGKGALVAAGSIVTKSVPDGMVVGGNPAKILCSVDEFVERNLPYNLNSKRMGSRQKKNLLLSLPDDKFIHK